MLQTASIPPFKIDKKFPMTYKYPSALGDRDIKISAH
jgi:hypothetical protein